MSTCSVNTRLLIERLSGCYTATWPRFCVETMYTTDDLLSRNTPSDQKRNPHPNVTNQSAYSASPSQLTLGGDLHSAGLPNPYQTNPYAYIQSPHDPTGAFGFPQPSYRPQQLQTHQPHAPPHLQHNLSPTNPRKRRASELEPLPGSSSSNASAFTNPGGLMSAPGDLDATGLGVHTQHTLPSPTVKKGRTNTPWTPAEEQRLKTLRDAGSSWSEIAKTFPTRTEGSCDDQSSFSVCAERVVPGLTCVQDMHYAEFAEDESAALLQAIKDYENNKWKVIGQKVGKPAKACEQFAKEQGWKV
ncbi:hypothetical protein AC578_2900 [Pseudocercospora eumusae]|uniref:Myb-like domain-containing protein n=1 Tax=Pseudocercospora eumusae TaxID=321146 RepID=A0A139H3U7_9PEZI|nr:hypothetical protein AC578_2900 [Pseudocercospora eumusae]